MESINKIQIGTNQYKIGSAVNTDFANALIGGENLLRGTRYPESTTDTNKTSCSWLYGKFVGADHHGNVTGYVPYINIENCPANPEAEPCGAFVLEQGIGFFQTSDLFATYMATLFDKYRNTSKGGNTEKVTAIAKWPITFSFYCKSVSSSEGQLIASPFFEETDIYYTVPTDVWKKISITREIPTDGTIASLVTYLSKMGFVCNVSGTTCYIACPMLTIGEYDVDWKENPLDSKSDTIGIGNVLRNSLNLPYGDYWSLGGFLCLSSEDFYSYDVSRYAGTSTVNFPIPESGSDSGKTFIVSVASGKPAGITQLYNNEPLAAYGKFPKQSALMSLICNSDRVIPVSMSIWCYADSEDVSIALMPIRVSNVDAFAPVTYEALPAGEWRRFTRTIYIPADTHIALATTNIWLGGALAASTNTTKVYFALPMVTLGSTPSTWFPSAYDIFSEISSVSSTASSALSTANSAASTASTANTNATNALNTANNKVSKSGDAMTGDLNMNDNTIIIFAGDETDNTRIDLNDNGIGNCTFIEGGGDKDTVRFDSYIGISRYGFYDLDANTQGTSSHLVQGDGHFRSIETTLTDSNNIPTSSAVKKLKVGGRNLLRGTKDITIAGATGGYWYLSKFRTSGTGSYSTVSYTDGQLPIPGVTKTAKLTCPTGSTGFGIAQDKYKQTGTSSTLTDNVFNIGDTLCLSYWVKPSAAGVICLLQPLFDCKTNTTDGVDNKLFTLSEGWQRIYYSGTLTSTNTLSTGFDIGYIYCKTPGASIEVCCPKLEFGEIPTDWTPALEDTTSTNYGFALTSVGSTSATSYTWSLSSTDGSSSDYRYLNHTASTLSISIDPTTFQNYQYLIVVQSTNACTITLTCSSGGIFTKGNITSFTVAAGQSIEFSAVSVASLQTYITYTIFG